MNTRSPSLGRALWSLVAFIFYPILSLIWMEKVPRDSEHAATFSILAVVGFIVCCIGGVELASAYMGIDHKPWLVIVCATAYVWFALCNLTVIARAQSEAS